MTTMSTGIITDPRFNAAEKDFGILIENGTGHHYLYIKDEFSQDLPQGTIVEFMLMGKVIDFENNLGSRLTPKLPLAQCMKPK